MEEIDQKIAVARAAHIEMMACAFLRKTGLSPEACVLVEQSRPDGTVRWWFEQKNAAN